MQWIAPSEKDAASTSLEKRLWDSADQFRANSGRKAQKYSGPILGLIFLRFAKVRFAAQRAKREFDAFGHIYEYFLGEFVMSEGQGGGEFYTPASIVQLLAQVIERYLGGTRDLLLPRPLSGQIDLEALPS